MPGRKAKPPRLYLRERAGRDPVWVILHRGAEISTECGPDDHSGAARSLAAYIGRQHQSTLGSHSPADLAITDVLTFYAKAKNPGEGAGKDALGRYDELLAYIAKLLEFWGDKAVGAIKGATCREYVTWRTAQPLKAARKGKALGKRVSAATARRDLEVLRAAVNLYHAEYTLTAVPKVTLPPKSSARERWLTRHEAARLLGAACGLVWDPLFGRWKQDGAGRLVLRDRVTRTRRRHIRRFILIGLYTGTRHEAVERLQWHPNTTGGWIDLERGRLYRRGIGERESRKRRPPAKIAHRLMAHVRRWAKIDARPEPARERRKSLREEPTIYVIHRTDGSPLSTPIRTGWEGCLADAGLEDGIVPHVLRHTAATWLMQAGVDPWEAAGMLGMTIETLQGTYGHHHPDFQEEAAGAFGGRR
ncbi:tyrosine-type recombinase/integrase [Methylobacterium sp. ID0610]|uniref:tyrosine-type recombinase/integrase n=1 Tax=Methylobacterium carpenticola TaxID=3344827 RepID=UPI00368C6509